MGDFEKRREHLKKMSDKELKDYFWELADKITEPLVEFASRHTSPSIERAVLLRMGFNSIQADGIVKKVVDSGLLGKGAGHVVMKASEEFGVSYIEAGKKICEDNSFDLQKLF